MTQCSLGDRYNILEESAAFILRVWEVKLEAAGCSEVYVPLSQATWRHILENGNLNIHHNENLRS
jgi:hypothetical protein